MLYGWADIWPTNILLFGLLVISSENVYDFWKNIGAWLETISKLINVPFGSFIWPEDY